MSYGRPCLNSRKSSVVIPSVLEEESSEVAGQSPLRDATSTLLFFLETIRLYKILENILGQVYDPWKESEAGMPDTIDTRNEKTRQVSCVVGLDSELDRFEATVPGVLQWTASTPSDGEVLQCQRNVLKTR